MAEAHSLSRFLTPAKTFTLSDQAHSASIYLTADLPLAAEPISQMGFPEAKCLLSGPSKISNVFKTDPSHSSRNRGIF